MAALSSATSATWAASANVAGAGVTPRRVVTSLRPGRPQLSPPQLRRHFNGVAVLNESLKRWRGGARNCRRVGLLPPTASGGEESQTERLLEQQAEATKASDRAVLVVALAFAVCVGICLLHLISAPMAMAVSSPTDVVKVSGRPMPSIEQLLRWDFTFAKPSLICWVGCDYVNIGPS